MMNKFLTIAALSVAAWSAAANSQTSETAIANSDAPTVETARRVYGVGDVPNVRLDDRRRHVSDPNGMLSVDARDTIDALLSALEDSTGHQVAVAMLPSIGDADPFSFSQKLAEAWGVGHNGADDGLLIVYIADQRTIRFHTGYGLEEIMTDARSKRIQTQSMVPHFKEGDTDGGMVAGISAVCKTLTPNKGKPGNSDISDNSDNSRSSNKTEDPLSPWWLLLFIPFGGVIWLANWIVDKRRRCPHCGERGHVRQKSSDTFEEDEKKYQRDTYVCTLCGHEYVKTSVISHSDDTKNTDNTDKTDNAAPQDNTTKSPDSGLLGGNQSMGGSYGGGHFGGGGAQTKW